MKKVLIKCGGSILNELTPSFFKSLRNLKEQGYGIVVVHGGGPDINDALEAFHIPHEFHQGLRKTTAEAMTVVEMVLAGKTNRKLVQLLEKHQLMPIGVNGSDAKLLQADFLNKSKLGYVGKVTAVNPKHLLLLLEKGYIPAVTPIASTNEGERLNINADYAAVAIADALDVEHCIFVTDVEGISIHGKWMKTLKEDQIQHYIENGQITGGMIPKVASAIKAIQQGMKGVKIVSGKSQFYDGESWSGTELLASAKHLVRS